MCSGEADLLKASNHVGMSHVVLSHVGSNSVVACLTCEQVAEVSLLPLQPCVIVDVARDCEHRSCTLCSCDLPNADSSVAYSMCNIQ